MSFASTAALRETVTVIINKLSAEFKNSNFTNFKHPKIHDF